MSPFSDVALYLSGPQGPCHIPLLWCPPRHFHVARLRFDQPEDPPQRNQLGPGQSSAAHETLAHP